MNYFEITTVYFEINENAGQEGYHEILITPNQQTLDSLPYFGPTYNLTSEMVSLKNDIGATIDIILLEDGCQSVEALKNRLMSCRNLTPLLI